MTGRPVDTREIPEGYELAAVPDPDWRLVSGKRCRMREGQCSTCGSDAVAELDRGWGARYGRHRSREHDWWAYCPDHMYGRWIEGGQVMHWILRKKESADG